MNVKDCHDYTRHINDCSIEQKRVERVTGRFLRETDWVLIIEGALFCGTWCVASRRCFSKSVYERIRQTLSTSFLI